jgi:hypothetical protein
MARALGHIDADRANPARWRGHLDHLLPPAKKLGVRFKTDSTSAVLISSTGMSPIAAQYWPSVFPLPLVLVAAPRGLVRRDVFVGHLAKRGRRARLHGLGGALLSDGIDLIDADPLAQCRRAVHAPRPTTIPGTRPMTFPFPRRLLGSDRRNTLCVKTRK